MAVCLLGARNVRDKIGQQEVCTDSSQMHVNTLSLIIKSRKEVAALD
jgi:hypothetical protein